ncbi:MAG: hypothetical protein ACK5WZ_04985 [Pseudobdellovibrionaceae bacterium]
MFCGNQETDDSMKLSLAQPSDKKALAKYYKSFEIPGAVDLKLDRRGDFFKPYESQSDDYWTFILRDRDDIIGVATFVILECQLEGQIQKIAMGRDLRITQSRKAVMGWAEHFLPVMDDLRKNLKIKHFFSILNLSEVRTLNAFVRPRKMHRPIPRFYLYRKFNLNSIHGHFPFTNNNPLPHLAMDFCQKSEEEKLITYLLQKSHGKNLTLSWSREELLKKIDRFGLQMKDFLVAYDHNGNIVGSLAPWSAQGIQEAIPLRYGLRGHNFRQFLKFGQIFGWTRALTKPASRLKKETPLSYKYLLFLNADNSDIFESMLYRAYQSVNRDEFLVYLQMRSDFMYKRPMNCISAQIPYGLYALVSPNTETPDFLSPRFDTPVELEPFWV